MTVKLSSTPPASADDALRLQVAIGLPAAHDRPAGWEPVAALWARDRDLVVGQGVILETVDRRLRARLLPEGLPPGVRVGWIDRFGVIPEYREAGVEERLMRGLARRMGGIGAKRHEALIFVGEARAPVLLSTLDAMGGRLTDPALGRPVDGTRDGAQ